MIRFYCKTFVKEPRVNGKLYLLSVFAGLSHTISKINMQNCYVKHE